MTVEARDRPAVTFVAAARRAAVVRDYIAGMTDKYLLHQHEKLFSA